MAQDPRRRRRRRRRRRPIDVTALVIHLPVAWLVLAHCQHSTAAAVDGRAGARCCCCCCLCCYCCEICQSLVCHLFAFEAPNTIFLDSRPGLIIENYRYEIHSNGEFCCVNSLCARSMTCCFCEDAMTIIISTGLL